MTTFAAEYRAAMAWMKERERERDEALAKRASAPAVPVGSALPAETPPAPAERAWRHLEPKERADEELRFGKFEYVPRLGRGSGWPEF